MNKYIFIFFDIRRTVEPGSGGAAVRSVYLSVSSSSVCHLQEAQLLKKLKGCWEGYVRKDEWERFGAQADDIKYTEFIFRSILFWLQRNKTVASETGAFWVVSIPWTLSSQRPCSWPSFSSKGSSSFLCLSLSLSTRNLDLRFWNQIWTLDSATPTSLASGSLKSIPGQGLFVNAVMRGEVGRKCSWHRAICLVCCEPSLQGDLGLDLLLSLIFLNLRPSSLILKPNLASRVFAVGLFGSITRVRF